MAIDMHGPQAKALQAEVKRLRMEFNQAYSPSVAQRSAATPAATLGAGAGTSASTSAPLLPLSPRLAPSALTEMLGQRKDRRRKQLADHWKQVQNFLAMCPATNLVECQNAYDTYLAAVT